MTLRLLFHGGMCCGVKTLYGFPMTKTPETYTQSAKEKKKKVDNDADGSKVSSDMDFFTEEAPAENVIARLDRLIDFCKKRRPSGIIEATLIDGLAWTSMSEYNQVKTYEPYLLERGFKLSCKNKNSNSGNTVHVYHLCYG
jgi:hypothetical protein